MIREKKSLRFFKEKKDNSIGLSLEIYRDLLRKAVEELLGEKTGWGRVELKQRLFNLIDTVGKTLTL